MADPFLQAHWLEPLIFDVGGRAPISIRDQILRGHYLVDRAFNAGLLSSGNSILVVGAGVAGATTAILAARRGVRTLLVDASGQPFKLQANCTSRWVDPVQYDWPMPHFDSGQWPLLAAVSPHTVDFGFAADYADRIASQWRTTLNLLRAAHLGTLHVSFNTSMHGWPAPAPGGPPVTSVGVSLSRGGGPPRTFGFHLVVLARGMASERCVVEDDPPKFGTTPTHFEGVHFWQSDRFDAPDLGLPSPFAHPVLVSGSGDGALQDFIRLVTGAKSAREVLEAALGSLPGTIAELRSALWPEDDQGHRGSLWNENAAQDHEVYLRVHQEHVAAVSRLVHGPSWAVIASALDKLVVGRPADRVRLAHSCDHFSGCYPLNRFVVLLLCAYVEGRFSISPLLPQRQTVKVEPRSGSLHPCTQGCWGPDHDVTFIDATCVARGKASGPIAYSGVVIRHGIAMQALPAGGRMARQSLPYHLP